MDPPFDSVVLQSKVRGTGTITALLFKPRNVQVRLPPPQTRPRPSAPRLPHACGDRAPIGVRYDPRGCAIGAESSQLQLPPSGVAVAAHYHAGNELINFMTT